MRLIILFLICSFVSFAQTVSIELSIEWKKTKSNNWKTYKLKETPFLNIKYVNNSNDSIYFGKPNKYFDFVTLAIICNRNKIKKDSNYFKKLKKTDGNYTVNISYKYFDNLWEVLDENEKYNEEHESSYLNLDLQDIYRLLYKKYKPVSNPFFNNNKIDINKESIMSQLKDFFIFLKPNQIYSDSYDLTGFKILGGNYNFILTNIELVDSVETVFLEDEKVYKKEKLPMKINGFNLYVGKVNTNNISVNFSQLSR